MFEHKPGVGAAERLSDIQLTRPAPDVAWRPWVRLLDIALGAADEPEWSRGVPEPALDPSSDAPLLHGLTLHVDQRRVRSLFRELIRTVERAGGERHESKPLGQSQSSQSPAATRTRRPLDGSAIIAAAIAQDSSAIERLAIDRGLTSDTLAAIAQLVAMPILCACAARYRDSIAESWNHGYCPVCGAWPAIAEMRGLERHRRLRCGRCSTDWPIPVLRCVYCDEIHHAKLHALVPDEHEQTRRVDVCDTCRGYLKTFSTLRPMSLRSLAMMDLETIELDIVAQERGYVRPSAPAVPLSITITRAGPLARTSA